MRLEITKALYLTPTERATLKEAKEIFGQAIDLYEAKPIAECDADIDLCFDVYNNITLFLDECE